MPPVTGWFDPSPKGGALRLAANSYLPAKGDPPIRLPGLRRGDLIVLDNGRVTTVNGEPAGQLDGRPDFANLGAVHPNRPLTLETPNASSPRTAAWISSAPSASASGRSSSRRPRRARR